jgi:lipopolysaccharide transport system ATP-binding protein
LNLRIEPKTLVRGSYSIHAFINQPKVARLDEVEDVCFFNVIDNGSYLLKHGEYNYGSVFGNYKWVK